MSDTRNPLQSPIRPGALDVRGQQPSLFPFDAFIFDDPNRVDNPALQMREPWRFLANGIEVYEDGVDPENLENGNRRLILEGEVLKLQHYADPPGEWVDDISLGGYDDNGEFINYIQAAGITRETEDVKKVTAGIGLPAAPSAKYSNYYGSGVQDQPLGSFGQTLYDPNGDTPAVTPLGEYADREYFNTALSVPEDTGDIEVFPWHNVYRFANITEVHFVVHYDPTAGTPPAQATIFDRSNNFSILNNSSVDFATTAHGIRIYVDGPTGELSLYTTAYEYVSGSGGGASVNVTTPSGLFLQPGINKISLRGTAIYGPSWTGSTLDSAYARAYWDAVVMKLQDNDTGVVSSKYFTSGVEVAEAQDNYALTSNPERYSRDFSIHHYGHYDSLDGTYLSPITLGGRTTFNNLINIIDNTYPQYHGLAYYVDEGMNIPEDYDDFFFGKDNLYSIVDEDRDIVLAPDINYGKVVILSAGIIPDSYELDYITVTGPAGADGADSEVPGPAGEDGTNGIGVGGYGLPLGGITNQLAVKQSATDGDVDWGTLITTSTSEPSGGEDGDIWFKLDA